ncbi:hypothetical protein OVS_01845 [Mycoplasma ovis str. Michigan]|uniref:Uncharacterized protein n=1 Tax=Mycoplasma ovis str. Michigan TaxID=1415773 RepID=A0ABM5P1C8_9MOLU|nr:hypothetical protein [Mycoplasma ovis]AHC40252.1 hypothetical protein OVS_01845 [Mycoplasma ovis str. Michigan]
MFLTSKLIGIATGILSSGTITSVLYPYFQNSNWANHIYEKDSSFEEYNFKVLYEQADQKLKILNEKFKKFLSAEASAKFLKTLEFQKIKALFQSISQSEEKLKKLFDTISEFFKTLMEKNKKFQEASVQKLEAEKQKELQKKIQESYVKLQEALQSWEKHLTTINCLIAQKEEASGNCQLDESSAPPGEGLKGANKAKEELKKIQESLLKMIKEVKDSNGDYNLRSMFAAFTLAMATDEYNHQEQLLKTLTQEIEKLNESVSEKSKEANKVSEEINGLNKKLKNSYSYFSSLKNQESIFHKWKEKFNEEILKNKSDKSREIQLSS